MIWGWSRGYVVTNIDNSVNNTNFSFNTTSVPGITHYKIYAYRYGTDNNEGNSYDLARGRAYNTTNSVLIQIAQAVLLPVALYDFEGKEEGNTISLQWKTSSEQNSKGFYVERSENGIAFEEIAFIPSVKEKSSFHKYEYTDLIPTEKVYYRLRQLDLDGKFAFSPAIYLNNVKEKDKNWEIYPNPSNGKFVIDCNFDTNEDYGIFSIDGRILSKGTLAKGANTIDLTLAKGIYWVKVDGKVIKAVVE